MKTVIVQDDESKIARLVSETAASHEPIQIKSGDQQAVLIGEAEWRAIEETLYLLSIPGMRESIREGLETPYDECSNEPGW